MNDIPAGTTCCNPAGWGGRCGKPAKMQHNGKFYCGVHDPVKRAAKHAERDAAWRAKWAYQQKLSDRAYRIRQAQNNVIATARLAAKQQASWDDVAAAVSLLDAEETS